MWAPWPTTIYYKGEGGGFPQVWAMVSLVCMCCMWLVLAPKVPQLHTNHLMWVLCRPVWMSETCQLFLVPSRSSSTPPYPSKCYEPKSVPRLFLFPMFSTWTHIWVPQGVGSASTMVPLLTTIIDVSKLGVITTSRCEQRKVQQVQQDSTTRYGFYIIFFHLTFLYIFNVGLGLWDLSFACFQSSSGFRSILLEWLLLKCKTDHICYSANTFFS
jgi:hypothetical protein